MLSRVAEQLYWFGRHVERAENTARLVNVNANLIMDLPRPFKRIWANMIGITGSNDLFYRAYGTADEKSVLQFMLTDEGNPSSMACCVRMARENARSSREILPVEAWETINEFYLYVKNNPASGMRPGERHKYLNSVIRYCRQITGMLFSGMSHGSAYGFVRIGRNLERADMSTRIIDVGCVNLLPAGDESAAALCRIAVAEYPELVRQLPDLPATRQGAPQRRGRSRFFVQVHRCAAQRSALPGRNPDPHGAPAGKRVATADACRSPGHGQGRRDHRHDGTGRPA